VKAERRQRGGEKEQGQREEERTSRSLPFSLSPSLPLSLFLPPAQSLSSFPSSLPPCPSFSLSLSLSPLSLLSSSLSPSLLLSLSHFLCLFSLSPSDSLSLRSLYPSQSLPLSLILAERVIEREKVRRRKMRSLTSLWFMKHFIASIIHSTG
jgi:hypothetical protein